MPAPAPVFPEDYEVVDPKDTFEVRTGPFYRPRDPGDDPHFAFRVEEKHLNRSGYVHGGLLMTFADLALCATAVDDIDRNRTITVTLNSEFVSAGELGDLVVARCDLVRRTRQLAFVRGLVTVGNKVLLNYSGVIKHQRRD